MKHLIYQSFFILFILLSTHAFAQQAYTISGTVTDEKQEPVKGATVFISGSEKITATDNDGRFAFGGMAAGNYLLSVKMLGYAAPSQTVTIHTESVNIKFNLATKAITLAEVKIGVDKNREKYLAIFRDQFLGTSGNAKNCVIINPEIIHFDSEYFAADILLKADADDFLIIENRQLGYKIKYLLKSFVYDSMRHLTFYDGDNSFEELDGTPGQKKTWAQNRLLAYNGSLMHFLRSVYANTVLDEGFIANQLFKSNNLADAQTYIDPNRIKFDSLVTVVDSSFISFKFTALNIVHDARKAAGVKKSEIKKQEKAQNNPSAQSDAEDKPIINKTIQSSQLYLHLKAAVIDARGSAYTGYQTFLIRGVWANKRIGDQLPFEYLPPKTTD